MDPLDDPNDLPRSKLPYDRHRPDLAKRAAAEAMTVPLDPVKWKPVRLGLALVFWGWISVLIVSGLLAVFLLFTRFKPTLDASTIQSVAMLASVVALVGWLASFAGQCLCTIVPAPARARWLIIGSVAGAVGTMISLGLLVPALLNQPEPLAEPALPASEVTAPEAAVPRAEPFLPAVITSKEARNSKLIILAVSLVSQILFILFLKKVALYFNDVFLADGASSYLTLLVFHGALLGLLPPEAMLACFFWVIMLAVQYLLIFWFLVLVAGTRKAIG